MSNNRKRRSSILKPQKMRNPLSDINIDQPMETTFMRQSRRVSFASSNFIKEFTADPEKNTIWHMSYEEAAISTDNNSSAPIAQEVLPANSEANVPEDMSLTDSDEFNCTKICSFDNSVEEELIGANELEMAHSGSQIELCTLLGDCNKTTDIHFKQDALQFCEIVNEQKIQPNITDLKLQNLQFNESFGFANVNMSQPNLPSFIMGQENNCSKRGQLCRTALHDVDNVDRSDNTEVTKRRTIHFSQQSNDCDMDVTQSVPTYIDMSNKGNASQFKRRTLHFNQCSNDNNMDMTNIMPIEKEIDKENMLNTKHQIMHFNQESNYGDMELSQSIAVGMKIIKKNNSTNRRTLYNQAADNGDMEITHLIPAELKIFNKENIPNIKHQYIHFNQGANDGDMEMTQSFPAEMQTINNKNVCSTNREHISSTKRQTIHFNQAANGGDMEMTQSISAGMNIVNKENYPNIKRQSIHFNHISNDDYMEMTQAIPAGVKIVNQENVQRTNVCNVKRQMIHFNEAKRQTIHFNQTADQGNMEMTQAIPQDITIVNKENTSCMTKENVSNTKRQTIHFSEIEHDDNMVMTQSIPARMTQAIPAAMKIVGKENISNTKRQTIHFNQATDTGNMEMTQAIPAGMKIISKSNVPNIKRQTIHFNQCTGDMEMTQLIPAGMKIINKESVPTGNASNSKRQTINFNQISNDGNMDITLDIPTENTENEKIMTQDMHIGLKTKFAQVSTLHRQAVNISQTSNDFGIMNSRSVALIPIDNEISQFIPSANKLSNRLNSVLGSEMNTTKPNYYLDEITKSAPSGTRLLQKRENLFAKALLLDDESKSTGCNAELEKSYSGNDLSNANNIIDTQQQRRPTDNANNYNINYTQTVLLNADILENKEQIENAASNTLEDQYVHNEKREVPFHVKRQAMLMDSNTNEDICIRIRYPNQSDDCVSFNSSKMNLTPARSMHEQTTFNLSKNLSSYIDNTERLINYKTDGNPTSDYSKIINDDLNLSVLKSNISENNRQDISYNEQNCFVKEVNICDVNDIDVAERSNFENNTSVGDEKEENFHKPENVCKVGYKRLSDEMIDNVSEMPHKKDRIVDVPGGIINFPNNIINIDERIDITDIIDCEKNDSIVLVNSSSESECELSNEKRDVSGLDASCSDVKISVPSNFANLTSNATNVSQLCENSLKSFVEKNAQHSETIQCENVSLIESVGSEYSDDSERECDLPKINRNHLGLDIPCFHTKISIPPNVLNLIPNETCEESCENSLKSFVEKSILHSETLLCESVSLIESVNSDCSDDFAAVSFGAKQVKKLINKSVVDSALTEGVENIDVYKTEERDLIINRVKASLEKICPDVNTDIPVELVEEKSMEIPIVKKSDTFKERFCKLFKNPVALDESDKKELTLEEKIKEKSKDTLWNIDQLHNEHFTFTFMYDTIHFRVNIDRDTEIVKTAEFFSRFCESTSHPSAIFVHRILKKKLLQNHIKSACGQKYNILSLLDYITILGEQMRDILNEFDDLELKHGLFIDSDLNATFCPTNLFLRIAFEVTINISNIDNVSEKEINVKTLVGNVREFEVKRLAKGCPQGLPFLRAYILSIEEYLKFLQNAKQSRIRK